jgi:hypothetical protein
MDVGNVLGWLESKIRNKINGKVVTPFSPYEIIKRTDVGPIRLRNTFLYSASIHKIQNYYFCYLYFTHNGIINGEIDFHNTAENYCCSFFNKVLAFFCKSLKRPRNLFSWSLNYSIDRRGSMQKCTLADGKSGS